MIVVYASKWAVSAALLQKHEGVYWPINFSSRTLNPNEVNYGTSIAKDARYMLYHAGVSGDHRTDAFFYLSLVAPIFRSQWEVSTMGCIISNWTLEIRRCEKG